MESAHAHKTRWRDKALIALFLGLIALPLAARLSHLEPAVSDSEKRRLAKLPSLSLSAKSINAFPAAFEAYYSDHFGLRSHFIRWHNILKLRGLGVSPSPKAILGRDGWMFDVDTVDYFRSRPLTTDELEKWRRFLEERERLIAAEGMKSFIVITPSSCSIYPEFLPDSVRRAPRETRLDQLVRHLQAHSQTPVLDLRPTLLEAKSSARLYHRTDTHWNDHGAYVGYREIMSRIARDHPECGEPLPGPAFDHRVQTTPGGDIAGLAGLPDLLKEETLELVPRTPRQSKIVEWFPEKASSPAAFCMRIEGSTKPRAIVYHDSFTFASLYPFLAEHFSEIWFHWNHYFAPGLRTKLYSYERGEFSWDPGMMAESGKEPKPVIVIFQLAERLLLYQPPPTWAEMSRK